LRILHLHDAPDLLGGASIYLRSLVPALVGLGHESGIFSLEQVGGIAPLEWAWSYPATPSALRRRRDFHGFHAPLAAALDRAVEEFQPHLLHFQNMAPFRTTLFPAAARHALPVLMTVHDFSLDDPNPGGRPRGGLLASLKLRLDRRDLDKDRKAVFEAVDRFLCPTHALADGLGRPDSRAHLLRLPIAPAAAAPAPTGTPARLFFAGTLFRSKGVDLLLEALARAGGGARRTILEIAGHGDQRAALEAQARALGLSERVRFLGLLDAEQMDAAYRRADLQILPSRVPENSPLTVLEAGARGRPALASHAGGVPELLAPPERGWTFRFGDVADLAARLEEACGNSAERARRGAAMRSWVQAEFDPEGHLSALEAHYRDLVPSASA